MTFKEKVLECPFTWGIKKELISKYDEDTELPVSIKDQPLVAMMNRLTLIYCLTIKKDTRKVEEKLSELDMLRCNMDEESLLRENISLNVLDHIITSVSYYVCKTTRYETTTNKILEEIPDAASYKNNLLDIATLHGCKALFYSSFHKYAYEEAIKHAEKAVEAFKECPLWHFLLYKNYCCKRLVETTDTQPSSLEKKELYECTLMSKKPFYWIHQAQMFRDDGEDIMAESSYTAVYYAKPESTDILLKLANGLMKYRHMDKAKAILDKIQLQSPDNPLFLYQKGEYLCAFKEPKKAARHFKAVADATDIYKANIRYVACKIKADRNFNQFEFLLELLMKYEDTTTKQNILLHLALEYQQVNNFMKFCEYMIEAIQLSPRNQQLENFRNWIRIAKPKKQKKTFNIFTYVNEFIRERKKQHIDSAILQRLEDLCK